MMPDWSDWPDVWAAQNTNVRTDADKYPHPWFLHENEWTPVEINWLNTGTEHNIEVTFDTGLVMDILDSNYLWLDQKEDEGVWGDIVGDSTLWSDSSKSEGSWTDSVKSEDTTWGDSTKGSTEWNKKDYWQ